MIRNIDDAEYSRKNGMYGGASGLKDGVIIDGEDWLVKYPKNTAGLKRCEDMQYTTDPVSEYIGSHVYELLGYPVHETMLVERRKKIAVACKDFVDDLAGEKLLEIRTIKNAANEKLMEVLDKSFSSTGSSHIVDIDEILLHLKYNSILVNVEGATERFFDMAVVDAFINNSDRNNGNWGIIRDRNGKDRLAPIYDNGGAFNGKTPDSRLKRMLDRENGIKDNIMNGVTAFGKDGVRYSSRQFIEMENFNLWNALKKNVPLIKEKLNDITDIINGVPREACSDVRKEFYIKGLECRLTYLLEPAYEKALDNLKDQSVTMNSPVKRCPKRKR